MRVRGISDTFGLAGWLFADLLVALALLFTAAGGFGASVGAGETVVSPTPTIVPNGESPAIGGPVPPTVQPKPSDAISKHSICARIPVDTEGLQLLADDARGARARAAAVDELIRALGPVARGAHAEIVQTFGGAYQDPQAAERAAQAINQLILHDSGLHDALPGLFRSDTERRSFIDLRASEVAYVEIFLSLEAPANAPHDPACKFSEPNT